MKIAVIGAGSWGTTLASLLVKKLYKVYLWTHDIKHQPETYAYISDDFAKVLAEVDYVIIAVASKYYMDTLLSISSYLTDKVLILSATKGYDLETGRRMSEIFFDVFPKKLNGFAILSGPNISKEIADEKPAAGVVASKSEETAKIFQELLSTEYFRLYTTYDIVGVELGGTLKNVFAIAAGIADGYNFGSNAKSALIVRGINEVVRFGKKLGANPETFYGLTGIGDLITTSISPLSRNYTVGKMLAEGKSIEKILEDLSQVAEGINTTKAVYKIAKRINIELPIIEQIYEVLFNKKDPYTAVLNLMCRDLKKE